MIDDDEEQIFDNARQEVADVISTLVSDGIHPALTYAAILSAVSHRVTIAGFWGDERPDYHDFRGYWNLMEKLQEKAFAELAAAIQSEVVR